MGKLDSKKLGLQAMSICPSPSAEVTLCNMSDVPLVSRRGRTLPRFGRNRLSSGYASTAREMSKRKGYIVNTLGVQRCPTRVFQSVLYVVGVVQL